ncbi:S24 family peptidase [Deinococcus roseus]|uniref:Peptidase S24/S26A/S26B/S26C domain-containing protein n=1 Tax=Deinococcus roseus TaxID=392414 RepID=A0ABQ2DFM6_9DEIO|nr:S24 family peptidase [Deinococcus roseus]GGJ55074.1 hypothetical protein GCM10008938_46460 [Deinococcus roseus]
MYRFSKNSLPQHSAQRKITVPLYAFALASEPLDESPLEKHGLTQVLEDYYRPQYFYFTVQGNSMDNGTDFSILDGDTLVADTNDLNARQGHIYLWEIPGLGPCIKKLGHTAELGDCLISLNPAHRPFIPLDGARPIGRVIGKLLPSGTVVFIR